MKKYVVKPGDTLYNISQKTGVRIPLLLASNPQIQNPSQLMSGMSIVIPELGKKAKGPATSDALTSTPKAKVPSAPAMSPYFGFVWPHQIAPSDTWDTLSKKYGVSIEQLHHLNPDLAGVQTLQPGRIVYVPTPAYQVPAGQFGQTAGAKASPVTPPVQTGEANYGAHTHNPYRAPVPRTSTPSGYAAGKPGWYVSDESSSFLSDGDMRGDDFSVPDTDDDGWSETLTVRIDNGK